MPKTDNGDLRAKLDLRRYFLRKYHAAEPPRVLDCCAGSGRIWAQLRREVTVASYWPLDVKATKGRLKVDSARVVAQAGWTENVVDVDTYGSPWKHWEALLPNVRQPTTVFLTIGTKNTKARAIDQVERRALGLGELNVPTAIAMRLAHLTVPRCLGLALQLGLSIVEAREAEAGSARYLGVRLEPAQAGRLIR